MKLNTNTMVPKIIAMNTEISIVERTVEEAISVLIMENELEFASMIQKLIERMPKLQHFDEEIDSIKECLIDVFDGYGKKDEALQYMNFMTRVVISTKDYIKDMK